MTAATICSWSPALIPGNSQIVAAREAQATGRGDDQAAHQRPLARLPLPEQTELQRIEGGQSSEHRRRRTLTPRRWQPGVASAAVSPRAPAWAVCSAARRRPAPRRGSRRRLDDLGFRGPPVPRRRRRGDRRGHRARSPRGRGGHGRAGRPPRLRPRQRLHDRAARGATPARSRRTCRVDDPAIYPVSGGSEAIETALKLARAYHLARGEPDRWIVFARWGSYHGNTLGRSTCPAASRCAGRTRAGSAGSGTCRRPTRIGPADPGAERARVRRRSWPRSSTRRSRRPARARSPRSSPSRSSARRSPRPSARRLLAGDRRGLPAPRRPAHRRRGHDRLRADRPLVRRGSLGRPAGHPRRGQGRDVGLLAVRVRRRERRGPRHGPSGPGFVHGFTYSHHAVGAAVAGEVLRDPRARATWWRRVPPRATGCASLLDAAARRAIRTSARSAAAA